MRRYFAAASCVCCLSACRNPEAVEEAPRPGASLLVAAPSAVPAPSNALPDRDTPPPFRGSIYDLTATLTGQDGKPTPLDVFRGHPVIVTMFYGSCPNACPLLTTDIKRIDRQVPPEVRERLRVLMVSFDAPRDTPEKLAHFARDHGLDPARWKLASATEDTAREIAAVLGIRYRKLDNGEYFHSSAIILIDESGRPVARVEGIGKDPAPILSAVR
jgi:protein SCO1